MKTFSFPSNLAEETELLEALEWDEDVLRETLQVCQDALDTAHDEKSAALALQNLHSELKRSRGETVAKLAITLFLRRAIQYRNEEIEA